MKIVSKMARQGDLLFIRVEKTPENLQQTQDQILAHGEITGHAHKVVTPGVQVFDFKGVVNQQTLRSKFLKSETPIHIQHEEHGPIVLDSGNWEVLRQREYTPEGIKKVQD